MSTSTDFSSKPFLLTSSHPTSLRNTPSSCHDLTFTGTTWVIFFFSLDSVIISIRIATDFRLPCCLGLRILLMRSWFLLMHSKDYLGSFITATLKC